MHPSDTSKTILVTGATGFIGQHVVPVLVHRGYRVRALTRNRSNAEGLWPNGPIQVVEADLTQPESLQDVCSGVFGIVHLAGYAHAENGDDSESRHIHFSVTVGGTEELLKVAAAQGVRRVVYGSSVKAMGEGNEDCVDESCPARPETAYGEAKLAAEQRVLEAGQRSGMHVCNLRFPMVYGYDNKGNLPRMIAAIDRGWFPSLPEVGNRRSMVHVDDAVQATLLAMELDEANGQTYIVTDGQVYSTREIYGLIREALGRRAPRWAVPSQLLWLAAKAGDVSQAFLRRPVAFNSDSLRKLTGSAWYSCDRIQKELGYRPTRSLRLALPDMVVGYRQSQQALQ